MAEFKTLVARLDEAEQFLERASAPAPAASPYAPLDALDAAVSALEELTPRVGVFEKRALEKDPDKKVYGPKMAERVLAVAGRLADAAEAADELSDSLAPLRRQRSGERRAEQQREEEEAQAAAQAAARAQAAAEDARSRAAADAAAEAAAAEAEERRRVAERLERIAAGEAGADPRRGAAAAPRLGLSLTDALAALAAACEPAELASAVQALHLLCSNALAYPEDARFRGVRLLNETFQQAVARHAGGVEVLLALGFIEREEAEEDGERLPQIVYRLEEPPLEEPERWAEWYAGVRSQRDELTAYLAAAAIPPLPPATRSLGWDEAKPASLASHQVAVLHGQAGGGR